MKDTGELIDILKRELEKYGDVDLDVCFVSSHHNFEIDQNYILGNMQRKVTQEENFTKFALAMSDREDVLIDNLLINERDSAKEYHTKKLAGIPVESINTKPTVFELLVGEVDVSPQESSLPTLVVEENEFSPYVDNKEFQHLLRKTDELLGIVPKEVPVKKKSSKKAFIKKLTSKLKGLIKLLEEV